MWSEVPLTASDTHLLQLNKSGVGVAFTSRKGCNGGLRGREGRGGEEGRGGGEGRRGGEENLLPREDVLTTARQCLKVWWWHLCSDGRSGLLVSSFLHSAVHVLVHLHGNGDA